VLRRGCDQQVLLSAVPEFYFYLSAALALADQTDEALVAARRAAALEPDEISYLIRIGWILNHARRYDAARTAYEQVIAKFDKDPPSADTRKSLHDVRLALSNLEIVQNRPDRAEAWLEELWDEFPTDPGVLNDLGYSWADRGKHLRRSLRMIEQAVAAEPKNMAFRDSLGWTLYRLARFPEAIVELRTATAVEKPDPMVLDHLGDALMADGQPAAACETWRKAVAGFDTESEADKIRLTQAKIDAAASDHPDPTSESPPKPTP
jgi:Flp pilus assembly protein TadD